MELDVKLEKWVPEHEEKDSEKLKNESVPYIVLFGNLAWYSEDCYRKKLIEKFLQCYANIQFMKKTILSACIWRIKITRLFFLIF